MKQAKQEIRRPSIEQLDEEIRRRKIVREYRRAIFGAIRALVIFAAAAVLLSTIWFPVMQVQKSSMTPTLHDGEALIFFKTDKVKKGEIVAFHNNNQILIKRVIAVSGEMVDIDPDGLVFINGVRLEEPYLAGASLGECDIGLPCLVPAGEFFVMGDNRTLSLDSRNSGIGTVSQNQVAGKALFRIWPLPRLGFIR